MAFILNIITYLVEGGGEDDKIRVFGCMILGLNKKVVRKLTMPKVMTNKVKVTADKVVANNWKKLVGMVVLALVAGASGGATVYLLQGASDGGAKAKTNVAEVKTATATPSTKAAATATPSPTQATGTVTSKANKPELAAYVVADCPYGKQMQTVMVDAMAQVPAIKENFVLRYFFQTIADDGSSYVAMHGASEGMENARQICLREEQPTVFWAYVECYAGGGSSESCVKTAKVDKAKMDTCVGSPERGVKFAKADNELAGKHKITGSPSLIVNNSEKVSESAFGGRNAQGLKNIVCASAEKQMSFCNQALEVQAAPTAGNC
jgi:hypothetical protein